MTPALTLNSAFHTNSWIKTEQPDPLKSSDHTTVSIEGRRTELERLTWIEEKRCTSIKMVKSYRTRKYRSVWVSSLAGSYVLTTMIAYVHVDIFQTTKSVVCMVLSGRKLGTVHDYDFLAARKWATETQKKWNALMEHLTSKCLLITTQDEVISRL